MKAAVIGEVEETEISTLLDPRPHSQNVVVAATSIGTGGAHLQLLEAAITVATVARNLFEQGEELFIASGFSLDQYSQAIDQFKTGAGSKLYVQPPWRSK
jgi:hypothetical protein